MEEMAGSTASSDLRVGIARVEDAPALHRLVERAYRGDSARAGWTHEADLLGGDRTSLAEIESAIADPARLVLAAWLGPGPVPGPVLVGSVTVTDIGGRGYLGMLAVDPARQAAGIGRALVRAAEDHALDRFGSAAMEMTVISARPELIAWYERRGYAHTGERRPFPFPAPGSDRLDMVVLEKALSL